MEQAKKKDRRKRKHRDNPSQCIDPFHFLVRCDELSKEKPTKCPCSEFHRPRKRTASQNIQNFFTAFPSIHAPSSHELEWKPLPNHRASIHLNSKSKHKPVITKESKIRDQHDRGKKRKQTAIDSFLLVNKKRV